MLQDLGSYHLPILLTISLSPVFRPNKRFPALNFQKARWDDFAVYFDSHSSPAEEYSSFSLPFDAVLFTSLTLNAFLTICCSGQTVLFLFLLAKTALAYLPTALSVALRPPFFFQQAQYAQVFPLKPTPFCKLFAGLGSSNKSSTSLLFLSDSRSVLSSIFSFTLISGRNCFLSPPVLSGYNGSPDTCFSRATTRLMSWPNEERYMFPQQSIVVSLFLSLVYTFLFSRTGGILLI